MSDANRDLRATQPPSDPLDPLEKRIFEFAERRGVDINDHVFQEIVQDALEEARAIGYRQGYADGEDAELRAIANATGARS